MTSTTDGPEPNPSRELEQTRTLLDRYSGGDLDALGELCSRYYDRVLQVVRSRLGRLRTKVEAEDCVQQVFVDALRSVETFNYRGPGSFMNWLATIAVNRLNSEREHFRAGKRDQDREKALESLRGAVSSSGAAYDPEAGLTRVPDRVAREEESDRLLAALAALPDDLRKAAELRWMLGCTLEEVMEAMDLPNDMAAHRLCTKARVELGRALPG